MGWVLLGKARQLSTFEALQYTDRYNDSWCTKFGILRTNVYLGEKFIRRARKTVWVYCRTPTWNFASVIDARVKIFLDKSNERNK